MDKRAAIVLIVIFGGLLVALFGFLGVAMEAVRGGGGRAAFGAGNVGVVEIKGPIVESDEAVEELQHFLEDDGIRAVVVRVDSPGGQVGPSQEIHAEIRRLAGKKVVVVSMGSVAASGGYYLATSATKIVANPGTLTGSIGVITQVANVQELADKIGVEVSTVKSGPAKDAGNPFRPFTGEDRAIFQGLVEDLYGQFVEAVAEGRRLPVEDVRALADGRVYSGQQALERGLVDQLGNFTDAVELAGNLAGIEGKPKLAYPPKSRHFNLRQLLLEGTQEAIRAAAGELHLQLGGKSASIQYRMP